MQRYRNLFLLFGKTTTLCHFQAPKAASTRATFHAYCKCCIFESCTLQATVLMASPDMKFDSVEAMKAFGPAEELTETRRQAGAVIESGVMAPISDEFFSNFPEPLILH